MIPMIDLSAQYRAIKPEVDAAIQEVIDGNQFILGPAVERFERAFATYCQTEHAVGVSSGTSALHIALLAAGVGPGDEVITVAQSFTATAAAVLYCGAKPIFVDVEPDTALMDASLVEAAITDKTKAILPVHLYGHPVDIAPLL